MTDDEALRRRLYRPDADVADVAAYLAAQEPEPQAAERGPAPSPSPSPPRRRRWAVGAIVAVVAAAVLVPVAATALAPPAGPAPLPTRSVDAATSGGFVGALRRGDDAGLGRWWATGSPYLEQHGSGDRTIELPVSASARGGRLTVLLVLADDAVVGWSAARLVIHDDRTIHLQQQATASGRASAGIPVIGRFTYPAGHRPLRLLVRAPAAVRWGVAAVFDG